MNGKFIVEGISLSKQGDDLVREELKQDKAYRGDHKTACDGKPVSPAYAGILSGSVIKSDDRL